ncbi:UBP1-associated protein 2C-like [Chenopodium quinoa]|uniref:RRM domain-containing protein n=1 Tax=Chenopodium quinoa TaxID=63459 RepID=A0A803LVM6_CHEQI|nr:UBP1-associated protein 2C-like [Chenopodium quinoa]XP_021773780.1 UBP1-associated protein 2C-like [Chenopodium quinoa]XP_021773781.1 UBP1-associated protein 2C-like [Chenopodium quinoa]
MDPTKKRKLDENGLSESDLPLKLTPDDVRKIIESFSPDQLRDILQNAAVSNPDVLQAVRVIADRDVTQRKLFIRGLGWETTSESLRSVFAAYGELEEAVVILDKNTAKSKGYGFVTYKHIDGAVLALKEPSKKIDGRVAVAQLASAGLSGGPNGNPTGPIPDASLRKIYVGNVPHDMPGERLLAHFSSYGEIEEGPLGFDKQTGKSKGFALFVYKTPEAAQASLMEPVKNIDGRQMVCKLASEGKKGKNFGGPGQGGQGPVGNGMGMQPGGPVPGPYSGPGGPGGYPSYGGGYSGGPGGIGPNQMNSGYPSSVGGQGPGGYGGSGGYGGGVGGGYGGSQYGGPNSTGYGGYGGAGSGLGAAVGGAGRGGSMYGMPPSSGGMPPAGGGGYSDGGHYGGYPSQQHQPTGTSPAPRGLPAGGGGGYPNAPPYY